jgi:predicted PurR-regulated permease PerM
MSRLISLVVLVAIAILVGALFYKVMASFILPLFLAVVLVVVFAPLHQWFIEKCNGRGYLSAGLTTAAILFIVLLPTAIIFNLAAREAAEFATRLTRPGGESGAPSLKAAIASTAKTLEAWGITVPEEQQLKLEADIKENARHFLEGAALVAGKTIIGFLVMVVALYFFLLEGPEMIRSVMALFPLDDAHLRELVDRFTSVSRAIVSATLLAAVTQGILAGIAFWFLKMPNLFLLVALTTLLAMIPFVGAVSVWLPCALWLHFQNGNTAGAIGLAIYGAVVISQVDNVIKPWVLHGQSKLHPLLALLSVLGGVQALGPIGILVGPMAVAFLQTLLQMLQTELAHIDRGSAREEAVAQRTLPVGPPWRPLLRRIRMMGGGRWRGRGKSDG